MAEVAPAPVDPPAAKPKKKTPPKTARNRNSPTVKDLIIKIVSESKERKGVSTASLKKQLAQRGYDVEKNKARFRIVLKGLVAKETLTQTSGIGASGSFKLAKKAGESKKKTKTATTPKKSPARQSTSKGKGKVKGKAPRTPKPKKAAAAAAKKKKKSSSPKKMSKKVAVKKATPVKNRKAPTVKKPQAKKAVSNKKTLKKTGSTRVKKTATKK